MASRVYAESLLSGLDAQSRRILRAVLDLVNEARWGRPIQNARTRNFGQGFLQATTPGVADTEFLVPHGLETAPHLVVPILPVGEQNAKVIRLTVTRPADGRFLYLSSPDTNAVFWILVEAG